MEESVLRNEQVSVYIAESGCLEVACLEEVCRQRGHIDDDGGTESDYIWEPEKKLDVFAILVKIAGSGSEKLAAQICDAMDKTPDHFGIGR